jgi:hypothetical protein
MTYKFNFLSAPRFLPFESNPNRVEMHYSYLDGNVERYAWYAFSKEVSLRLTRLVEEFKTCKSRMEWQEKYESGDLDRFLHILRDILPKINPDDLWVTFPEGFECDEVYSPSDNTFKWSKQFQRQYAERFPE